MTAAGGAAAKEFTSLPITLHRLEERRFVNRRAQSARVPTAPWKRATQTRGVKRLGVPVSPALPFTPSPPGRDLPGAPRHDTVAFSSRFQSGVVEAVVRRGEGVDGGSDQEDIGDWDGLAPGVKTEKRQRAIRSAAGRVQQRYYTVERKISAMQEEAEKEASKFESVSVWMAMTAAVADQSTHNNSGKLLRVSAATQILERLAGSLALSYGKWIHWALAQLRDAIFFTHETSPPRPAIAAAVEEGLEWGDVGRAYFHRYTHALVAISRWEEQNHRQTLFRKHLCPVISRSVETYQCHLKRLYFNAWRCYKEVSRSQSRVLVNKMWKFFRQQRMRMHLQRWRTFVVLSKAEREVKKYQDENKRLHPQVRSLTVQLQEEKRRNENNLKEADEQVKQGLSLYQDQIKALQARVAELEASCDSERRAHDATKQASRGHLDLLNAVAPGLRRDPPSKPVLWCAYKLKEATVECKVTSKFTSVQAKGVEKLLMTWVAEVIGSSPPPTLTQLADRTELVAQVVAKVVPDVPKDVPWDKQLFAALARREYQAPPMAFLCPTAAILAMVGAKDFAATMLLDGKLLKALAALFLLRVCFVHLHTDMSPFASALGDVAAVRAGTASKSKGEKPEKDKSKASTRGVGSAIASMKPAGDGWMDDGAGRGAKEAQEPQYDDSFSRTFEQAQRFAEHPVMGVTDKLNMWTGLGALVSMYLNKLKHRQCVAAVTRLPPVPWEQMLREIQSGEGVHDDV
eukprot:TRINITY_DN2952_c0_g2_i1.p1 TRINITY_DN2952_c0_g2~~TRINITY_DN2952_c0_g2_i1.p1  ORF type:complete len:742 (+),score=219.08 TRINITY_DN2952_c0_g2_i1:65-2290(+)